MAFSSGESGLGVCAADERHSNARRSDKKNAGRFIEWRIGKSAVEASLCNGCDGVTGCGGHQLFDLLQWTDAAACPGRRAVDCSGGAGKVKLACKWPSLKQAID